MDAKRPDPKKRRRGRRLRFQALTGPARWYSKPFRRRASSATFSVVLGRILGTPAIHVTVEQRDGRQKTWTTAADLGTFTCAGVCAAPANDLKPKLRHVYEVMSLPGEVAYVAPSVAWGRK